MLCVALRLGNAIQLLQSLLMYAKLRDAALRSCLVVSKLTQICYVLIDHVMWAAKLGLVEADVSRLGRIASRLWLISLTAGLLRDVIEILRALRTELTKHRHANDTNDRHYRLMPRSVCIISRMAANRPLLVDCVKNSADLFLPLTTLGYINIGDWLQGLMGMISSYMAILTVWDPALKLSP